MDASVLICTRNRADSLARTLQSLVDMKIPPGLAWELVVVDNASTDHTGDTIAAFGNRLPIRAGYEVRPGVSNARNCAVAMAKGHYLIWTDDDVVVARDWLAAYVAAFRQWPDAAVFGGKVIPVLEEPVTAWFAACQGEVGALLAARDFGEASFPLDVSSPRNVDKLPFGANCAIRAAEQSRFAYDPDLGAGRNRVGAESLVMEAILVAGGTGYYIPDCTVHHMISPRRQTLRYVYFYYRAHGATSAIIEQARAARLPGGVPSWLIRRLFTTAAVFAWAWIFARPQVYVRHLKKFAFAKGYADYLKRQKRHARGGHGPAAALPSSGGRDLR